MAVFCIKPILLIFSFLCSIIAESLSPVRWFLAFFCFPPFLFWGLMIAWMDSHALSKTSLSLLKNFSMPVIIFIFKLEMCISRLEMCISSLEIHIFRLEI